MRPVYLIPLLLDLTAAAATAETRFDWMPRGPAWFPHSVARAVSDDGCIVGGELTADPELEWAFTAATRWRRGGFDVAPDVEFVDLSGDGRVLLYDFIGSSYRWEDGMARPIRYTYVDYGLSARALSRDGSVIVGNAWLEYQHPVRWLGDTEVPSALPTPAYDRALEPLGLATDVSADGDVAVGWVQDFAGRHAARWPHATLEPLPPLPGASPSLALGVSADGTTAVGRSGSRAVRWRNGEIEDLGPGEAFAATSDGTVALIRDGESFLWEGSTGRRAVRELLENDFGADLAGWTGVEAHDITPDGQTLVGRAVSPLGKTIGWRARRSEERCPQDVQWRPLIDAYPPGFAFNYGMGGGFATTPGGWLYIVDAAAPALMRTRLPEVPGEWPSPLEFVLPIPADPDSGYPLGNVGPGTPSGQVYVRVAPQLLLRVDPDGSVTEVVDGAAFPPVEAPDGTPLPTAPGQMVVASDGTAFVAAWARALRVDPGGTVTELFDAAQAHVWSNLWLEDIGRVARAPNGWLYWTGYDGRALLVTDSAGAPLDLLDWADLAEWGLAGSLEEILFDSRGGLWMSDGSAAVYITAEALEAGPWAWPPYEPPTLPYTQNLQLDANDWVYFVTSPASDQIQIQRRSPEGVVQVVYEGPSTMPAEWSYFALTPGTLVTGRAILREPPWYSDLGWPQLVEVTLPPPPSDCDDGLDSDGDGLVDLEDPGCLSALDTSERSPDLVCDNGLDDDGDGLVDFPLDPGCAHVSWRLEDPACSDGLDNDGDGTADWNGAAGLPADPECAGDPGRLFEQGFCGLGYELGALAVGLRIVLRRRLRRGC